jgi:hypothetical protein
MTGLTKYTEDQIAVPIDAVHPVGHERGTPPGGVLKESLDQAKWVQRTIPGRPERSRHRVEPGPTTMNFITRQPLASVSLLLLPCHFGPQSVGVALIRGYPSDPRLPQSDVDAGGFPEGGGQNRIMFSGLEGELEEGIGCVRFYLGRQHAARGTPRLTGGIPSVEYQDPPAANRQFPGAGRTYGPSPDYDHVPAQWHVYPVKLFETSGRTAA